MKTPKSKFVKKKIKETSWKDREYIEDLLFLEKAVIGGVDSWMGNWRLAGVKSEYRKEYNAIFEELDPEGFKKYAKKKRREKVKDEKEEKKFEKEEAEEEKRDLKMWKKMGGKI
ncbi:MAG: hypothetical protein KAU95_04510 [Candidatus Aenigmarchaeota archaeon]|nr:hypothetical protein [Candidatus Aenigmarchaeota archaeon]